MDVYGIDKTQFEYLRAPLSAKKIRHLSEYCRWGKEKKSGRRIFNNVKYTEFEELNILLLEEEVQKRDDIVLSPDWTKVEYLKCLYNADFSIKKAVENVKTHATWRVNVDIQTLKPKYVEIYNSGMAFFIGRDKEFRPILYFNFDVMKHKKKYGLRKDLSLDEIQEAMDFLATFIRKMCFTKYFVENWVMIFNCKGFGLFTFPTKFFKKLLAVTSLNHAATMHKMFLCFPSGAVSFFWKLAKPFLPKDTLDKINLISKKELHKMNEYIEPSQLLEEFGGTLKKPKSWWPPVNTFPENPQPEVSEEALKENYYFPDIHNNMPENFQGQDEENNASKTEETEESVSLIEPQNSLDEAINVKRKTKKYFTSAIIGAKKQPEETSNSGDAEVQIVNDIKINSDFKNQNTPLNVKKNEKFKNPQTEFTLTARDRERLLKKKDKKGCSC